MPWCVPIPMMTSGANAVSTLVISADAEDYDLFVEAGSPASPVDLYVTLNSGVTIDTMTANGFEPGTNIYFTVLGTLRGRGGGGGQGGDAEGGSAGPAAAPGEPGLSGGHAFFSSAGIGLFLNIDSGNAWGGGGGGGGGAGKATLENDDQGGGGGGGGQGWNTSAGGTGGTGLYASGGDGGSGSSAGAGGGGSPGNGGGGGAWGLNGAAGASTIGLGSGWVGATGGSAGTRGRAFLLTGGASISFTGDKDLATLESEGRLKGGAVAS